MRITTPPVHVPPCTTANLDAIEQGPRFAVDSATYTYLLAVLMSSHSILCLS